MFGRYLRLGPDTLALLALLAAALFGLMAGYARSENVTVGIGDDDRAIHVRQHLQSFHAAEAEAGQVAPTYRWTKASSVINLPGLGRGLWQTQLRVSSPVPVGEPKQALITAGSAAWLVQLQPEQRQYHLLTPSEGDLRVSIDAPAAQYGGDPRQLGIVFRGVELAPIVVSAFPPAPMLLHIAAALVLVFVTLRVIGLSPLPALAAPLGGVLLLSYGIADGRAPMGLYSLRLLAVALLGLLLTLALRWALPRMFRWSNVDISQRALVGLLLVTYAAYLVRACGLQWPYFLAIDIEWHMEKTRRVLNGRIAELWNADSSFHQSVMPTDEWGENKPLIPYSPFYHIFSTIWAVLPWPLEMSANIFSAVIDTLRAPMIFFIVRKFHFSERAGVIAALTYTIIPASLLMHAWGNTPTTNGMWWSLLAVAILVGAWDAYQEKNTGSRWAFALLTLVLAATMLFYTVTAVFTGLLFLGVITWLIGAGRRRQAWPLLASLVVAAAISTAIFYWQFVPGIVERTLPKLIGAAGSSINDTGKQPDVLPSTWGEVFTDQAFLLDIYGMYLPLGLGLAGWWIGVRRFGLRSSFSIVMTVWLLIAILFWFIGTKIVMVDKQLFWLMPWMGIGTGIAVDRMLHNRSMVRWVVPLLVVGAVYTFSDALYLWTFRLQHNQNFTSWLQLLRQSL